MSPSLTICSPLSSIWTQITRDDEIVAVIVHETLYPVNVRDILYRHSVQHKVADPVVHNRMKHFRAVLR